MAETEKLIAQFPTPEGDITVWRDLYRSHAGMQPWVVWVVLIPGYGRHTYSRKMDAMHHAKAAVRLLNPPLKFDLVKAWDKVRTYG